MWAVSSIDLQPFQKQKNANMDKHLRSLIKLSQSTIIFSVFSEVFLQWLESIAYDHRQVSRRNLFKIARNSYPIGLLSLTPP
jgi:hypothetical protein